MIERLQNFITPRDYYQGIEVNRGLNVRLKDMRLVMELLVSMNHLNSKGNSL